MGAGRSTVRLRQETSYSAAEKTDLTLRMERPLRFRLRLRVPGWCEGFSLRLNDAPFAFDGTAGDWATIEREWQPNDRVTARFPMEIHMVPVDKHYPRRVAIMFGPAPCLARMKPAVAAPSIWHRAPRFRLDSYAKGNAPLPYPGHCSRAPLPLAATFFRVPGVLALLDLLRPRRRAALLNRHRKNRAQCGRGRQLCTRL